VWQGASDAHLAILAPSCGLPSSSEVERLDWKQVARRHPSLAGAQPGAAF
jgi:hypothetical protein